MDNDLMAPSNIDGRLGTDFIGKERGKREMPTILIIPEMSGELPSPCSYIRLLNPLMTKRIQKDFCIRVGSLAFVDLANTDIVIINRIPCNKLADVQNFLKRLRRNDVRLIYELDDDLLNIDPSHPEKMLYKEKEEIVQTLVCEADLVWVSTDALARSVGPMARRVQVHENFIESKLLGLNKGAHTSTGPFRILYMGTKTHSADLNLVMAPLRELHSEGAAFELVLIGVTPDIPNESWIKSVNPPSSIYPLFMQWLRSFPAFDLGIAPLDATRFNECKSALKFWDYTAMGGATLASRFGEYKRLIADGETGLLADGDHEWREKLRFSFENKIRLREIWSNAATDLARKSNEIDGEESRRTALLELFCAT